MKVISVLNQKGGVGKSTLSVHLTVAAQQRGMRVLLLDCDPQGSASAWRTYRATNDIEVLHVDINAVEAGLERLRAAESADLVLIDSPPSKGFDAAQIVDLSDLVLIPTRPGIFDLAAAKPTADAVRNAGKQALFVISAAKLRSRDISLTREALRLSGLPVARTVVHDRTAYARALQQGLTGIETDEKAAAEMLALFDEVMSM